MHTIKWLKDLVQGKAGQDSGLCCSPLQSPPQGGGLGAQRSAWPEPCQPGSSNPAAGEVVNTDSGALKQEVLGTPPQSSPGPPIPRFPQSPGFLAASSGSAAHTQREKSQNAPRSTAAETRLAWVFPFVPRKESGGEEVGTAAACSWTPLGWPARWGRGTRPAPTGEQAELCVAAGCPFACHHCALQPFFLLVFLRPSSRANFIKVGAVEGNSSFPGKSERDFHYFPTLPSLVL